MLYFFYCFGIYIYFYVMLRHLLVICIINITLMAVYKNGIEVSDQNIYLVI